MFDFDFTIRFLQNQSIKGICARHDIANTLNMNFHICKMQNNFKMFAQRY